MARRDTPAHLLVYKREHDDIINHLVAHECGHVLRLFRTAPQGRLVARATPESKRKAITQLSGEIDGLSRTMADDRIVQVVNMWFEGNVKQVTNFPADLMIERWIHRDYPALRRLQAKSIERQRTESLAGLKDEVARISPATLLSQSNVMNYAFFRILGLEFGTNWISPYSGTPAVSLGKRLAELTQGAVDGLAGDIAMSDRWAELLGMTGWFDWVPFEEVGER